jgi:hypothetical protein
VRNCLIKRDSWFRMKLVKEGRISSLWGFRYKEVLLYLTGDCRTGILL